MQSYRIEGFKARVQWAMMNLGAASDILNDLDLFRLSKTKEFYSALEYVMKGSVPSETLFYDIWGGREPVPWLLVDALLEIFPSAEKEMFTTKHLSDFHDLTAEYESKVAPWLLATDDVASERGRLARAAKEYYQSVDEAPEGIPLVAKKGWLLECPIRLKEPKADEQALPSLAGEVADVVGSPLWPGGPDYMALKTKAIKIRKGMKAEITNGITFRLIDFEAKEGMPEFTFSEGYYYNYVNTLEVLAAEFALHQRSPNTLGKRGSPEQIFHLNQRSAFPGVNCLLIVKNFEGDRESTTTQFILHERTQNTMEAQNTMHVIPAGGHQPHRQNYGTPITRSIWRTAVREFIEELFNKEELSGINTSGIDFLKHPDVAPYVRTIFKTPGCAEIYYLGMGFDPLTTKPEVLVSIIIDWKAITRARPALSKGNFIKSIEQNYEGGTVHPVPLSPENLVREAKQGRYGKPVLPAGAACMMQAAQPGFLEKMLNLDVERQND
ncbi:hypothetical protein I5192_20130 (plasmid) [Ruegeria sp. SCSIO 43209]|uniref:hypothetical protein n=1 Tax=Ruegeria sp. SCSIO 43209 TaxID=2793010 RepID=UPI001CA8C90F|nr:hypothetical protein [Ruegeria sp. SCSIO 43209]UAB91545.1 hypothetical protein I5192_20130 [Ruegeria sp. SCSIO 43209]